MSTEGKQEDIMSDPESQIETGIGKPEDAPLQEKELTRGEKAAATRKANAAAKPSAGNGKGVSVAGGPMGQDPERPSGRCLAT